MTYGISEFLKDVGLELRTGHSLESRDGRDVHEFTYIVCEESLPEIGGVVIDKDYRRIYYKWGRLPDKENETYGDEDPHIDIDACQCGVYGWGVNIEDACKKVSNYLRNTRRELVDLMSDMRDLLDCINWELRTGHVIDSDDYKYVVCRDDMPSIKSVNTNDGKNLMYLEDMDEPIDLDESEDIDYELYSYGSNEMEAISYACSRISTYICNDCVL